MASHRNRACSRFGGGRAEHARIRRQHRSATLPCPNTHYEGMHNILHWDSPKMALALRGKRYTAFTNSISYDMVRATSSRFLFRIPIQRFLRLTTELFINEINIQSRCPEILCEHWNRNQHSHAYSSTRPVQRSTSIATSLWKIRTGTLIDLADAVFPASQYRAMLHARNL
jgi:hypothetical protein